MEDDGFCLNFAVLHINLISTEYNRDIFTYSYKISVPVGNILVRDSRCNIKHNNGTVGLDVVTITKTSQLLLASSVPDIESVGEFVFSFKTYKETNRECKNNDESCLWLNYFCIIRSKVLKLTLSLIANNPLSQKHYC